LQEKKFPLKKRTKIYIQKNKSRTTLWRIPAAEKTKSPRIVAEHEVKTKFSVLSRKSW